MGQHQVKQTLQRKYSFGNDEFEPQICQENDLIENQLKVRKQISTETDISKIQLSLYKKDFYLLKLNYQLNYFNNVFLSDVEGISLALLQVLDQQNILPFLNIMEFLSRLIDIKRMQIDILDIQDAYLTQFINSILQINTLQELTVSSNDDSSVSQSHFQQIILWISEQKNMKKLTLSLKFKMIINQQFYNYFEGLFLMEKLRLEFSENCVISSDGLIQLGKAISKYFRLTLLTIQIITQQSHIDSNSIHSFAQNLEGLQALEQFSFSLKQDYLKAEEVNSVYNILEHTVNLKSFQIYIQSLSDNQVQDQHSSNNFDLNIPKKVKTLKYLILNIELNNLNSYCLNSLCGSLPYLENLETLEINIGKNGNIQDEDYFLLFQSIQKLTNLRDLEINLSQNNYFNKSAVNSMSICLGELKKLNRISFTVDEQIKIENDSVLAIYEGMKKITKLKQFFISVNNPFQIIFIGLLQHLKKLDEDGVQFCYLDKVLFERTNHIQKLNLHLKQLNDNSILGLSQGLSSLNQLEYLHLRIFDTCLNQQQYKIIGESIIAMKQLICLSLDFDEQDTNLLIDFGLCLQFLENLRFLVLALNQLEGLSVYLPKIKNLNKLSLQLRIEEKNQQGVLVNLNQLNNILISQNKLIYFNFDIQCSANVKLIQDSQKILSESLKNLLQLNHFKLTLKEKQPTFDSQLSLSDYLLKNLQVYSNFFTGLQKITIQIQEQNFLQEKSLLSLAEALPNLVSLNQFNLQIDKSKQKFSSLSIGMLFKGFNNLQHLNILNIFIFNIQSIPIPEIEEDITPNLIYALEKKQISHLTLNQELTLIRKNRYRIIKKLSNLCYLQSNMARIYY